MEPTTASPVLCDLDGVIWRGADPIPGAAEAVAALRGQGREVVFVTNNSSVRIIDQEAKLAAQGIPAEGAVISSSQVAARLVEPGERVLCCGGEGLAEELDRRGAVVVPNHGTDVEACDAVVVGFNRDLTYDWLRVASAQVRGGARLLASNDDATFPAEGGLVPGGGALLAAIERASGVQAVVAGKPYEPMARYLVDRFGPDGSVVGDRPDTDGRLARAMGWAFVLVLSGVAASGSEADPPADRVAADIGEAVRAGM